MLGKSLYDAARAISSDSDTESDHESAPSPNFGKKRHPTHSSYGRVPRTKLQHSNSVELQNFVNDNASSNLFTELELLGPTLPSLGAGKERSDALQSDNSRRRPDDTMYEMSYKYTNESSFIRPTPREMPFDEALAYGEYQPTFQHQIDDDVVDASPTGPRPEDYWNESYPFARDEDVESVEPWEHGIADQHSHQPNNAQKIQLGQTHERIPLDLVMSAHMSMKQALMDQGDDVPDIDHTPQDERRPYSPSIESITGL